MDTQAAGLLKSLEKKKYDFLDIGCSHGGSLTFGNRKMEGKNGVGLDINPVKVALAKEKGFEAYEFNILENEMPPNSVNFVTCFHTLEHLPDIDSALLMLKRAIRVARNFVLIRHPYFDDDGRLASMGRKYYHSDWSVHTNSLTTLDHFKIGRKLLEGKSKAKGYYVYGRQKLDLRNGEHLVPLDAPQNISKIQAADMKQPLHLDSNYGSFKEIFALIDLRKRPDVDRWRSRILKRCNVDEEDLLFKHLRKD